jgi:hypothetical protein
MDGIDCKVEMDSVARYGWLKLPGRDMLSSGRYRYYFQVVTRAK